MSDYIEEYITTQENDAESPPGADTALDTAADGVQTAQVPAEEMEDGLDELQEETQEKPKRRGRRKKDELSEEADIVEQDDFDADESEVEDDPLPPDDDPQVGLSEAGASSRIPGRMVTLDSSGNVIRERMQGGLHELSVLTAARNARRILTATVDAIETDGEALPRMVFYVGTVKVMIPFQQMGLDLDPEMTSQREARLLIDSMLGAKIDYMVRGVDAEARIAAASRRDAMLVRQATILNARGISSKYRINEGMRVTARIIHVGQYVVRVEVYGFECYVPIHSISNLWVNDIREVIQVGEERPVEITSLTRGEDGRVTAMQVSMRAAEDAPQLLLREGNTYTGNIIGFSDKAYFVRAAGMPADIRCPVKSNHTMEPLNMGDLVKFYVRGIHDGVPTGAILKVLKRKFISEF